MRRRLATTRITLRADRLPPSAETTELNYRTKVTTPRQDTATLIRLASILTINFIGASIALRLFSVLPFKWGFWILVAAAVRFLFLAYSKFLQKRPPWIELGYAAGSVLCLGLFTVVHFAPTMREAYLLVFCPAIVGAAVFGHFVTFQVLDFMAVNERVRRRTMRVYQRIARNLWTRTTLRRCPELWPYRVSFALLGAALTIGFGILVTAERTAYEGYAAMCGVLAFLASLPTLWMAATWIEGRPEESIWETARITMRALSTFLCYNRHQVEAAGLFRFPTKLLRPPLHRDIVLGLTLVLLSTAVISVSVSSPAVTFEKYWPKNISYKALWPVSSEGFTLEPIEERFAQTLSDADRASYFEAKKKEHVTRQWQAFGERVWRAVVNFVVGIVAILLLAWLGPFLVLFAVLWFTSGRILLRFHHALEHHHAYEVPPEPTEDQLSRGGQGFTVWANRIERMQWSANKDEREHFYLGTSMDGDYPVLLHEKLLHTHAHLLGDTGSGKTALGIAPLLTQLIARDDSSVVVIDLKGDITLFETCRIEAENNGLPFKYFTNIPGRASYIFNPFKQSHAPNLTSSQLTQGMLQALALEYGDDYGRAFFSALNEIVLSTYVRRNREQIHSFRDLLEFVADKKRYQSIGGNLDDWEKTRHLASIVEKLAQAGPLNVSEETPKDSPRAFAEQIDMASVLRDKQVVYFYLSTPLEPTTVSPIAKLAMFSLLTAAARRDRGEKNRVYVFIDEFQRVISENLKLFLEQARSFRLHFILANQSVGQLNRTGIDLTDVVESNTAFKQSFRATDTASIKRLMETSGEALYHSLGWTQILNDSFNASDDDALSINAAMNDSFGFASAKVGESVGPRLEKNTIIDVSSQPLASFVRFTHSSGFTQYGGTWTTLLSEYHIAQAVYGVREIADWPEPDEKTVVIGVEREKPLVPDDKFVGPKPPDIPPSFEADLDARLRAAANDIPTTGPTGTETPKG